MPTSATMPRASSQAISSSVVTPPATVIVRPVAASSSSIAGRLMPRSSPSTSTLVKRWDPAPRSCQSALWTGDQQLERRDEGLLHIHSCPRHCDHRVAFFELWERRLKRL